MSDFNTFSQVWSNTPKRRRGGKMSETQQVQISMLSPDHGKRATKDASTDELLCNQCTKVQKMKQLDRLLKRNPTSTKACTRQIYNQVNKKFFFYQSFNTFNFCVHSVIQSMSCALYFQLQTLGLVAEKENSEENYRLFYHLAAYIDGMETVPEKSKAQALREKIVHYLSRDEGNFLKVKIYTNSQNYL